MGLQRGLDPAPAGRARAAVPGGCPDRRAEATAHVQPEPTGATGGVALHLATIGVSMHPDPEVRACDTLDWYAPRYLSRHTVEEVAGWFAEAGLFDVVDNFGREQRFYHEGQGNGVLAGRVPSRPIPGETGPARRDEVGRPRAQRSCSRRPAAGLARRAGASGRRPSRRSVGAGDPLAWPRRGLPDGRLGRGLVLPGRRRGPLPRP